jgi:hypothetical protein
MIPLLQTALVVGNLLLFFTLLSCRANRPAMRDPVTGELILQYSKKALVLMVGINGIGVSLLMVVLSFVIEFEGDVKVFFLIGLGVYYLAFGWIMWVWAVRRRTRISERGLTSEYVFARPRFLAWEEVERIHYPKRETLWVCGRDRRKAALDVWFAGVEEAVSLLWKHLPEVVIQKHEDKVNRFAGEIRVRRWKETEDTPIAPITESSPSDGA